MSATIITLPRVAKRARPVARDSYDWLRVEAMRFVRTELADDTPAPAPEAAEILAALRRIEQQLVGVTAAAGSPEIRHQSGVQ